MAKSSVDLKKLLSRMTLDQKIGQLVQLNANFFTTSVSEVTGPAQKLGVTEEQIVQNLPVLRAATGDRAVLRALHFVRENERVGKTAAALKAGDVEAFLQGVLASGNSSFKYLQNVYTVKNVEEQGLSLALSIAEGILEGKGCAVRVHGGGFAGTTQAFVRKEYAEDYRMVTDSVFGEGACMMLTIRPIGATRIDL